MSDATVQNHAAATPDVELTTADTAAADTTTGDTADTVGTSPAAADAAAAETSASAPVTTIACAPFNADAIPAPLRTRPQFVCWRYQWRGSGEKRKKTKVPLDPKTGEMAKTDDAATWATFDVALAAYRVKANRYAGIGYVFGADDPFTGIDLDKSLNPDGSLKPWAAPIVAAMDTYTEVSPSLTGVKMIAEADLPDREGNKKGGIGEDKTGAIEMYDELRFFTLTSQLYPGSVATIEPRQQQVLDLHVATFPDQPKPARKWVAPESSRDDVVVIEKITKPAKWSRLWHGDTGGYPSGSEALFAMLGRIRCFVGDDRGRIAALFDQCALAEGKWKERKQTWRDKTLSNLLSKPGRWYYEWRAEERKKKDPAKRTPTGAAGVEGDGQPPAGDDSEAVEADPHPMDLVREAIDAAKAGDDAAPIFDAADHFARLSAVEFAKVKAELRDLRELTGVAVDLNELQKCIKDAKRAERKAQREGGSTDPAFKDLTEICVSGRQMRDVTADALRALSDGNKPPTIFLRSVQAVRLRSDDAGRYVVVEVNLDYLRSRMERTANYYALSKEGEKFTVPPPLEVVKDVTAVNVNDELARLGRPPLPALRGVTESPVLRPDGSILSTPGYDAATRLYYAPGPGLEKFHVPERPTRVDAKQAVSLILDVIGQFPYADDGSRANVLAAVLTLFCRSTIGRVPIAAFDKPAMGTGASLLAEAIALAASGRDVAMRSGPKHEDEWRKTITSMLTSGPGVVIFDNVEDVLESEALASVTTSAEWSDRVLGTSVDIRLPTCPVFVTGNNLIFGRNLARRCYRIRLDAQMSRPEDRTGFKIPNLLNWIKENRGLIVGAALTIARAWHVAGKPKWTGRSKASFEEWTATIGGMLAFAGCPAFLGNEDTLREETDEERIHWTAFLSAWESVYGLGASVTVSKVEEDLQNRNILREALPPHLAALVEHVPAQGYNGELWRVKPNFKVKLGKDLRRRMGMRFGDDELMVQLGEPDRHTKVQTWKVVAGSAGSAGGDFNQSREEPTHLGQHNTRANGTPAPAPCARSQGVGGLAGAISGAFPASPALPANEEFEFDAEERAALADARTH
jgi:hypothetical protein